MNLQWKKINGRIANLNGLFADEKLIGMIEKPLDENGDKNAWRAFTGYGANAIFVGHSWTKAGAKRRVQAAIGHCS